MKFTGCSWDIEWNYSIGIVDETLKIKHGWEIIVFLGGAWGYTELHCAVGKNMRTYEKFQTSADTVDE